MWNGAELHALLNARGTTLELLSALVEDDTQLLDSLFELLLTRDPSDAERAQLLPALTQSDDRDRTLRALAHAIVLSREFTSIR